MHRRAPGNSIDSLWTIGVLAVLSFLPPGCDSPGTRTSGDEAVSGSAAQPGRTTQREELSIIETCAAKDLQYLIGQPESVLDTMRFGTVVRIERPGDIHTMEYSAERTRIIIGDDGRIARVICG